MGNEVELPGSGEGPLEVSGHKFTVRTVRTVVFSPGTFNRAVTGRHRE